MDLTTASCRALSIPEITEAVFLLLPARDLLVNVQRVSKAWQDVIASPMFQRLLFLEPRPRGRTSSPDISPLLQEAFPHFSTHSIEYETYRFWPQESLARTAWARSDTTIEAFQRKEASWRTMFPVQPPVKKMDVIKKEGWMGGSSVVEGKLLTHRGVKMGVLYDLVEDQIHMGSSSCSTNFDLEWHVFASESEVSAPANGGRYVPPMQETRRNNLRCPSAAGEAVLKTEIEMTFWHPSI